MPENRTELCNGVEVEEDASALTSFIKVAGANRQLALGVHWCPSDVSGAPLKAEIKPVWMYLLNLDPGLESWHLEVGFLKTFSGLRSAGIFL